MNQVFTSYLAPASWVPGSGCCTYVVRASPVVEIEKRHRVARAYGASNALETKALFQQAEAVRPAFRAEE
ncbi:hypothetical protein Q5H89_01815 [Hymenobacter sp. CA2-7]|nr:hypothetical protein [Hymenobacter sp. CA2-7]